MIPPLRSNSGVHFGSSPKSTKQLRNAIFAEVFKHLSTVLKYLSAILTAGVILDSVTYSNATIILPSGNTKSIGCAEKSA